MKRFDARNKIIEKLKELKLYGRKIDHKYEIPICNRSKDIVEPLIKSQWFVDCKDVAKRAIELVKSGDMKIYPDNYVRVWYDWLENIQDWCISRQLWWGHQIPAYRIIAKNNSEKEQWVAAVDEEDAINKATKQFGYEKGSFSVKRDEDVIDTWFSSGLLPFAALGWPDKKLENGNDLAKFFPNSLLETGSDILFFWVARMVFFSLFMLDSRPFDAVYLHSMVRDAFGRKMSKSLGNVIDPFMIINGATLDDLHQTLMAGNLDPKEIAKASAGQKKTYPEGIPACGADALRFSLCSFNISPKDINMDVLQIQAKRAFCNKIWNAFKLVQMKLGNDFTPESEYPKGQKYMPINQWIFTCLKICIEICHESFNNFQFPRLASALYDFFMSQFCHVYLECIKPIMEGKCEDARIETKNVLYQTFRAFLLLIHPLMPFITEELFQRLPRVNNALNSDDYSICVTKYPYATDFEQFDSVNIIELFNLAQTIIKDIRSIRGALNLTKQHIDCFIESDSSVPNSKALHSIKLFLADISALTLTDFKMVSRDECSNIDRKYITKNLNELNFHIMLPTDLKIEELMKSFELQSTKLKRQQSQLEENLNESSMKNLPEESILKNQAKLDKIKSDLKSLTQLMASLTS